MFVTQNKLIPSDSLKRNLPVSHVEQVVRLLLHQPSLLEAHDLDGYLRWFRKNDRFHFDHVALHNLCGSVNLNRKNAEKNYHL